MSETLDTSTSVLLSATAPSETLDGCTSVFLLLIAAPSEILDTCTSVLASLLQSSAAVPSETLDTPLPFSPTLLLSAATLSHTLLDPFFSLSSSLSPTPPVAAAAAAIRAVCERVSLRVAERVTIADDRPEDADPLDFLSVDLCTLPLVLAEVLVEACWAGMDK